MTAQEEHNKIDDIFLNFPDLSPIPSIDTTTQMPLPLVEEGYTRDDLGPMYEAIRHRRAQVMEFGKTTTQSLDREIMSIPETVEYIKSVYPLPDSSPIVLVESERYRSTQIDSETYHICLKRDGQIASEVTITEYNSEDPIIHGQIDEIHAIIAECNNIDRKAVPEWLGCYILNESEVLYWQIQNDIDVWSLKE